MSAEPPNGAPEMRKQKRKQKTLNEDSSATHLVRVSSQVHSHNLLTHDCDAEMRESVSRRRRSEGSRNHNARNKSKQLKQTNARRKGREREAHTHTHPLTHTHHTSHARKVRTRDPTIICGFFKFLILTTSQKKCPTPTFRGDETRSARGERRTPMRSGGTGAPPSSTGPSGSAGYPEPPPSSTTDSPTTRSTSSSPPLWVRRRPAT